MMSAAVFAPIITILLVAVACALVFFAGRSLIRYSQAARKGDVSQKKNRENKKITLHDL